MNLFLTSARRSTWIAVAILAQTLLSACGGGGSGVAPPGVPLGVTVNPGDGALSLGWKPPASNGGAAIQAYSVELTPAVPPADVTATGTVALVRNLTNGIGYQVSVRASNAAGTGPASTPVTVQPAAAVNSGYTPITIQGDNSPSGIYDPSILRANNGVLWLSYSSVDYHNNGSGQLVQDVGTRIARSNDNGNTFSHVATIATPTPATVTDTDPALSACGAPTCTGRWVYETSWLIEDSTDPDPNRRFKLFAHKYFLYPPGTTNRTLYHLGVIVMWTAAAPDGAWSIETPLIGWNLSPPELTPLHVVNAALHPDLGECLLVAEGSATVRASVIDFVFACPFIDTTAGNAVRQKIVRLRSTDHLSTLDYVTTLLEADDAAPYGGAGHFSAPALIVREDNAPLLLVTPVVNNVYAGSLVFPFADDGSAGVFRTGGLPETILFAPVAGAGHIGGASTYDGSLGAQGILQSDATLGATLLDTRFDIVATHAMQR
ncbi:MAG: fibronectin type III domain-containing protein [Gammaproteobacteria bacterium]